MIGIVTFVVILLNLLVYAGIEAKEVRSRQQLDRRLRMGLALSVLRANRLEVPYRRTVYRRYENRRAVAIQLRPFLQALRVKAL